MRRSVSVFLSCLAGGLLASGMPANAQAQGSIAAPGICDTGGNRNGDCRMHLSIGSVIQPVRRLVVTPGSTFAMAPASGSLTAADYESGAFDAGGSITLTAQSNAPWRVTVQANSGTMSSQCVGTPSSSIRWGTTSANRSTPLAVTPTTTMSGSSFTAGQTQSVFLRVALNWLTDGPVADVNCALPMTFTITAP